MKWADLENLPMIDRITDLPEQTDRAVTKSTAICNHGRWGVASAWSRLKVIEFYCFSVHRWYMVVPW